MSAPGGLGQRGGGRSGGGRPGGGGMMRVGSGGMRGGSGWRWHPSISRFIFVGGGSWGGWSSWPYWYGNYPYWPYDGYPYGYDAYGGGGGYPYGYAQPQPAVQQAQQPSCPTSVRLSDADLDSVRKGQSIRLTGANQCGQAVDVTVQRVSSSQVSGLDGGGAPAPAPLDGDGGYGFSAFSDPPPPMDGFSAFDAPPPPPPMGDFESGYDYGQPTE